jgi:hypothetical protein
MTTPVAEIWTTEYQVPPFRSAAWLVPERMRGAAARRGTNHESISASRGG